MRYERLAKHFEEKLAANSNGNLRCVIRAPQFELLKIARQVGAPVSDEMIRTDVKAAARAIEQHVTGRVSDMAERPDELFLLPKRKR